MRKYYLAFISLFAGFSSAFAQMMPDSTVQVVAYWNVGDKQHYQVDNVKYKIENGDTTVVEKSAEILEFEVVAADEEKGYRVKVTTMESQYSDRTQEILSEKWREKFGPSVQYFETGPDGEFLRVLPIEGLDEQLQSLTETVVDALMKNDPGIDRMQILPLLRQMLTPEAMMASAAGEISPLFMYHGVRLGLDEVYEIEDEIPMAIGNGTIKMKGRFGVDKEFTDDYSVVLHMVKSAEGEQLKPILQSIVGSVVQAMTSNPDEAGEASAAVEEVYRNASISMEDYVYEEVHLGSGWPIDWSFSRETQVEIDGQKQGQLIEKTVRIIIEE